MCLLNSCLDKGKITRALTLCCLTFYLISPLPGQAPCYNFDVTQYNLAYFNLQGKVKTVTTICIPTPEYQRGIESNWNYKEHLEFSESGNLLKRHSEFPSGKIETWDFDEKGRVTYHVHGDSSGRRDTTFDYQYAGEAISKVTHTEDSTGMSSFWEFENEANGKPKSFEKKLNYKIGERTVEDGRFMYEANGNLIRKKIKFAYPNKQRHIHDITFDHDTSGRVIKQVWMDENGRKFLKVESEYNEEGNISKQIRTETPTAGQRGSTKIQVWKYEYDPTGNPVISIARGVRRVSDQHKTLKSDISYF